MPHEVDYYELLGVARGASPTEIKSAYRALAKVMHPDAGGTSGTFRLLQEAYRTLSEPARRAEYDRGRPNGMPEPAVRPTRRVRRPRTGSWSRDFGEDPQYVPPVPGLEPAGIPWWWAVDPDERVRYLPVTGPGHGPALAVLGGWLLLVVPVVLPVPFTPLVLTVWLALLAAAGAGSVALARKYLAAARGDRAFAAEVDRRAVFGSPASSEEEGLPRAHLAERLTAELLARYLARLPGARVFHGLALPGSVFADVDHAVLCGRRLVLVESKLWLPGHYEADETGGLWRNDHPFRGGALRLPQAVAAYREWLPNVQVRGAVVIYPSREGVVTASEDVPDVPAPPMTPDQFVTEIGSWLAAEPASVHKPTFRAVLGQLVSP